MIGDGDERALLAAARRALSPTSADRERVRRATAAALAPGGAHGLMLIAGVVEIAAGVLVAFKPKLAAPVVAVWLVLIIINLVSMGAYLDVALRDLGLALGAVALWRLATEFDA